MNFSGASRTFLKFKLIRNVIYTAYTVTAWQDFYSQQAGKHTQMHGIDFRFWQTNHTRILWSIYSKENAASFRSFKFKLRMKCAYSHKALSGLFWLESNRLFWRKKDWLCVQLSGCSQWLVVIVLQVIVLRSNSATAFTCCARDLWRSVWLTDHLHVSPNCPPIATRHQD